MSGSKKARADVLIHEEHDRTRNQRADRGHEQDARDDDRPDHDRDVEDLHPRRACVHGRGDEVDPSQQEGGELERNRDQPERRSERR